MKFKIKSKFKPAGDQPKAIRKLVSSVKSGKTHQTLLGVTGSGKTFSIANVIQSVQMPTLVIAPNKTLAAQLAQEFREFFPNNAVEYFVSYYDYYQPEAYLPVSDTYIEKEADINQEIDRLRHSATASLMSRKDVIVVASVSCIYGLGSPEIYREIILSLKKSQKISRQEILKHLISMYYTRSEILESKPGKRIQAKFRVRGNNIEVIPPNEEKIYRISLTGDKIKSIEQINYLRKVQEKKLEYLNLFSAKHYIAKKSVIEKALKIIKQDLDLQLRKFSKQNKLLQSERLERRVLQDIEMIREIGYCSGIENYSRYFDERKPGQAPYTLLDYFTHNKAGNFLLVIDESHITVPQIRGMYRGDRSRKQNLVDHGFRLPSALDNRPLKAEEFWEKINQTIYTSATPSVWECDHSGKFIEQIIRPTGLVDPELIVQPVTGKKNSMSQIHDLLARIKERVKNKERVLVTTLTKKMAEDLSDFLRDKKIKSKYLHSGVKTLDRVKILQDLRRGKFDCLVGVNLLREGLDLPEVSLVAILDADKEGFLRSRTSLIQTIGRAARNIRGQVILYADNLTGSIKHAIRETNRRRKLQLDYNKKHKITPKSIAKKIASIIDHEINPKPVPEYEQLERLEDIPKVIRQKEREMKKLAKNLEFEKAALLRDEIRQLKKLM
ncbi:excinuclease ABC subunit B [bacterium]|nr:excinuclease ABC subunit B [bacterium]|tara:strand:- start:27190 stop:29193 length:2004 start_codon:yes stop_codon:yes gene_type:complete